MNQEELRKNTKLAKALNDEYTYKDFAKAIELKENSFYNWLHGYYNLSNKKAIYLDSIIENLIE